MHDEAMPRLDEAMMRLVHVRLARRVAVVIIIVEIWWTTRGWFEFELVMVLDAERRKYLRRKKGRVKSEGG
jgi:hypothetical protein